MLNVKDVVVTIKNAIIIGLTKQTVTLGLPTKSTGTANNNRAFPASCKNATVLSDDLTIAVCRFVKNVIREKKYTTKDNPDSVNINKPRVELYARIIFV